MTRSPAQSVQNLRSSTQKPRSTFDNRGRFTDARPRIISDNGPQYIAKDFKEFIRISGMTHVRISPYYPQSNGKIERWHKTMKSDAMRPASPSSLEEARRVMERFVEYYNGVRLHSAIGSELLC